MRERDLGGEAHEGDPYWTADLAIGEAVVERQLRTLRLQLHRSEETFRGHQEFFPLQHRTGTRTYVHARPYFLAPDITLTIDLYSHPQPSGAIGEVADAAWRGMRHLSIGNAQAWLYHEDRSLVLWECFLEDFCRQPDPTRDAAMTTLWTGFERVLLEQFPTGAVERLVTPYAEHLYTDQTQWQAFLRQCGYAPLPGSPAAFAKTP